MRASGLLLVALAAAGCAREAPPEAPAAGAAQTPEEQRVEAAIAAVDAMRSARAASIPAGAAVDTTTFAEVCKPVGKRLRAVADSTGWVIRQAAVRNRNPANAATEAEAALAARFEADPALVGVWTDAPDGRLYARRITVEGGCLACHGARDDRPAFVAARYPDDRAHGFRAGDLRGIYTVRLPDAPSPRR